MTSEITITLEKIRALRERTQNIEGIVRSEGEVPNELLIDDKEMFALEEHIERLAAGALRVPSVDRAIWRPFWHAAYEDWNRAKGPIAFWVAVNRHLASTQEFLVSLASASTARSGGRRTPERRPKGQTPVSPRSSRRGLIRLFISHSAGDADLAEALIDLLRAALNLEAQDIRCTSVDGYRLPAGVSTDDRLRQEVYESTAFIGLVSDRSMASPYVVFELGARWGAGRQLIPLLAPGASARHLGGPLQGINALSCDSAGQLHQLVGDIGLALGVRPAPPSSYENKIKRVQKARQRAASGDAGERDALGLVERGRAVAFQVSWLLTLLFCGQATNDAAVEAQIEGRVAELGIELPSAWRQDVSAKDAGRAFNALLGALGGQLVVRKPHLVPYFEAGFNLVAYASEKDTAGIAGSIARLELPSELRSPGEDTREWLNRVHDYFESALQQAPS